MGINTGSGTDRIQVKTEHFNKRQLYIFVICFFKNIRVDYIYIYTLYCPDMKSSHLKRVSWKTFGSYLEPFLLRIYHYHQQHQPLGAIILLLIIIIPTL